MSKKREIKKGYVKCHFCHEWVKKDESKKIEHLSSSNKKMNWYFHNDCYPIYIRNNEERKEMDKLWVYIRDEIFKWDKGKVCPKHLVDRLQELKSGQEHINKNAKVFGNNAGYSYDVILTTFKLCKLNIVNSIANGEKFKNTQHLIDYVMVIVSNNINDVYYHIKAKEASKKKMNQIVINTGQEKFVNRTEISKNKVANKLRDIF